MEALIADADAALMLVSLADRVLERLSVRVAGEVLVEGLEGVGDFDRLNLRGSLGLLWFCGSCHVFTPIMRRVSGLAAIAFDGRYKHQSGVYCQHRIGVVVLFFLRHPNRREASADHVIQCQHAIHVVDPLHRKLEHLGRVELLQLDIGRRFPDHALDQHAVDHFALDLVR